MERLAKLVRGGRSGGRSLRRERSGLSLTGANPQPEVATMLGYADAVIETPSDFYVFEFKYRKSAKAAIRQICERDYAAK